MDQLQKEFSEMLQTLTDEVDRFFVGMSEAVDSFIEITEEIGEQVQNTIFTEIDQCLQDLAEPLLEVYWDFEDLRDDLDPGFPYQVYPTSEKNSACIGCRHYHGQVYGGELLVCGMHPYGWEEDNCPDWEEDY